MSFPGIIAKRSETVSSKKTTSRALGVVVEQLVRRVSRIAVLELPQEGASQTGIILDTELNGIRCILLRVDDSPLARISLSPRETEIARMVSVGFPNKSIAAALAISSWTVSTHLRRIYAKLGVGSRAAMVARLMESGVIVERYQLEERAVPSGPRSSE